MSKRIVASLAAAVLALAGCTSTRAPGPAPAAPAVAVRPAGVQDPAVVPRPSAGSASGCDPRASLRPPASLPAAGVMPAGSTMAAIVKRGRLRVGVDQNTYLFGYRDPASGQIVGFDIDIAQAVADKLGVELETVTPGWEAIVSGRWQDRWDLSIGSMTPTAARAEVLDFAGIYYTSPAVLVVHEDDTSITGPADLTGKRVGVGIGSTYEQYLQKALVIDAVGAKPIEFPFGEVQVVPSDETVAYQNLALGAGVRLDAVVGNLATTQERIDAGAPLRIVGEPLYGEPNAIAVAKGDTEWRDTVAGIVEELRADGTLKAISEKWLGVDITVPLD
jgi:polar amino acid transport system substrate-binding protein